MINLIDVERHLLNCKLIYNNDSLEIKNRGEFSRWESHLWKSKANTMLSMMKY